MKLTFLGTGAAEGVPAVFCDCETCQTVRKRGETEFHTRSQFMIDDCLCIDFPPDAYAHCLRFGTDYRKLRYLLVTHSHMDHFYAHDFILRGYKYAGSPLRSPLHIYGNADVLRVFEESTRREIKEDVAANIRMHLIEPFRSFTLDDGTDGYTVTPLLANHGKINANLYLIEQGDKSYLHMTDTGRLPTQTVEFLQNRFSGRKKVSFVTFDCTFVFNEAGEISRHMGLPDNRITQTLLEEKGICDGSTRYAITHYSHNNVPLSENLRRAEREYGYIASFDGLSVEI